jgi:hypothetical protein
MNIRNEYAMPIDEIALRRLDRSLHLANEIGGVFLRQLITADLIKPQTKVYIYKEGNHKRPHIHVYFGKEDQISLCINTGELLAGSMKQKMLAKVREWVCENRVELLDSWIAIQAGISPELEWLGRDGW